MHQELLKKLGAAAVFACCLAGPATAASLLGERYAALEFNQVFTQSDAYDNGPGFGLSYNHPLCDGIDLGASFTSTSYDGERNDVTDFSDQRLQLMVTAFGLPELDRIWVRIGAGFGMVENNDNDDTDGCLLGMIGTEYTLGSRAVLQPYVGWSDVFYDDETTMFFYGLKAVVDVADNVGVSFRLEGDHEYNITLGIGAVARF